MADIRPFRAIRYNTSSVKDLSPVICPPYDVIPPEMQQTLHTRSEYNFVRVEFPLETPGDDKYQRASNVMQDWLRQGVLKADDKPAFYVHDHSFACEGKRYTRRHIMARVWLEEWDSRIVRPHEGIIPRAKSDRLSLLQATQVNTSPVLAMYEDRRQQVAPVLEKAAQQTPVATADLGEEKHKLWAITDAGSIEKLRSGLAAQAFYIADGHHRYESALNYRQEKSAADRWFSADDPANFVLMALVAFDDPGLVILPPHRLVCGLSTAALDGLRQRLVSFFNIQELPDSTPDVWAKVAAFLNDSATGRLAAYGLAPHTVMLLELRDIAAAAALMPDRSELYRKLDVSIVDHVVLDKLTELNGGKEFELVYSHELTDAVARVQTGECQVSFLLSKIQAKTIKTIADAGDRMPRKSTYFYPKAPAGLVINSLKD